MVKERFPNWPSQKVESYQLHGLDGYFHQCLVQRVFDFFDKTTLSLKGMAVWQGLVMDSLKFHPGLPCPAFLCPACGLPLKQHHGCFSGGLLAERATCGRLQPLWTTPSRTPMLKEWFEFEKTWRLTYRQYLSGDADICPRTFGYSNWPDDVIDMYEVASGQSFDKPISYFGNWFHNTGMFTLQVNSVIRGTLNG
jgi:hypothetical protein